MNWPEVSGYLTFSVGVNLSFVGISLASHTSHQGPLPPMTRYPGGDRDAEIAGARPSGSASSVSNL